MPGYDDGMTIGRFSFVGFFLLNNGTTKTVHIFSQVYSSEPFYWYIVCGSFLKNKAGTSFTIFFSEGHSWRYCVTLNNVTKPVYRYWALLSTEVSIKPVSLPERTIFFRVKKWFTETIVRYGNEWVTLSRPFSSVWGLRLCILFFNHHVYISLGCMYVFLLCVLKM